MVKINVINFFKKNFGYLLFLMFSMILNDCTVDNYQYHSCKHFKFAVGFYFESYKLP